MNPDLTNISPDKHVNNVDVFGKTKQYKIRDSINSMDREKKDEGFTNNVFDQQNDKYEPNSQYSLDEEEFNNIKFKESLISYNTEKTKDFRVKLDLSVPNLHKENIGMSSSREMSSIIRKTPDFFKRINTSEDLYDSKNTDDLRYQERYVNNEDISEMRYNRNRSLHNATLSQGPSSSFFYQNDLNNIYSEQSSHGDGFFQSHLSDNYNIQQDTNCQSNNLFGQSFPYLNKKRSYSEADLNKSNRNNPFLNFRRNSQYNDDFYNKSSRQMSDVCIDPRMFYKNIPNNHSQIKNKENHHKPAFSYAQIITRALNASQDGKLTLGEIYKWIEENFEYYRYANPVWKNSIRHNLSLSKCFKKVAREPGTRGKGGKWMIDQEFIAQEEQRKKRKSFEAENLMNYHSYDINPEDPRFYQM